MKLRQIIFIFLFPIYAFADGVHFNDYTLDAVRIAFLVKIILSDSKKSTAKVEILKKYLNVKPGETGPLTDEEISDYKSGQTVEVAMKPPVKFVPRKWVSAIRYWDESKFLKDGQKAFLILNPETQFEFSDYSAEKENKFDLFFDQATFQKKLIGSSVDDLTKMLEDQDFESKALLELTKRNAIDAEFLERIRKQDTFWRILHMKVTTLTEPDRNIFFETLAKRFSTSSIEKQIYFLKAFRNYPNISIESKIKVYQSFKQDDKEVRYNISIFQYDLRSLIDSKKDYSIFSKIRPLYLEFLKNSGNESGQLRIEEFFEHLQGTEKLQFTEDLAKLFVKYSASHRDFGNYRPLVDEVFKGKLRSIAWMMTEIQLKEFDSSNREKFFNGVLSVLFSKEDLKDQSVKNKILKYANPYLFEAQYPISLTPENKIKYLEIGGLIYDEMDHLRLTQQKNLDELSGKFTYYFETALVVEIDKVERLAHSRNLVHLKIHKKLGDLKDKSKSRQYPNILNICDNAKTGETLLLSSYKESVDIIESLGFKKMILATKSGDYQFLIFDMGYEKKIESFFKTGE